MSEVIFKKMSSVRSEAYRRRDRSLYACGKVREALHELATRPESIRERVFQAGLILFVLSDQDFSCDEHRALFAELRQMCTCKKPKDERHGSFAATIDRIPIEKLKEIAAKICELECRLRSSLSGK